MQYLLSKFSRVNKTLVSSHNIFPFLAKVPRYFQSFSGKFFQQFSIYASVLSLAET